MVLAFIVLCILVSSSIVVVVILVVIVVYIARITSLLPSPPLSGRLSAGVDPKPRGEARAMIHGGLTASMGR